jgi:cytochrome c oxidase cbb3-type subunit I
MQQESVYNYTVVRQFAIMTVVWGIVGMAVGVLIAAELMFPDFTQGISWLSYGRLLPIAPALPALPLRQLRRDLAPR